MFRVLSQQCAIAQKAKKMAKHQTNVAFTFGREVDSVGIQMPSREHAIKLWDAVSQAGAIMLTTRPLTSEQWALAVKKAKQVGWNDGEGELS